MFVRHLFTPENVCVRDRIFGGLSVDIIRTHAHELRARAAELFVPSDGINEIIF